MNERRILSLGAAALFLFAAAGGAFAITQDFNGVPAGTVVAGVLPGGGTAPGTAFPDFTLSVTNNGSGPNSIVIFDSANPTGGDWDLGTPNEDFSGPGVGSGGESGMPGENSEPLGHLIVIAHDIVDGDMDGLVDQPNDEAGGGLIRFTFDVPTVVMWVKIVDIDATESIEFEAYNDGGLVGTTPTAALGNNSVQTVDLMGYGALTYIDAEFSGSGAIAEIEYRPQTTSTEEKSWGDVKKIWR
ncbi:MAG: hypothetical protein JW958_02815 [Candidatus Eisenbacteria bacterium]|nr:hypothetical protein [Candidatus Eisenbacteria bacterium]